MGISSEYKIDQADFIDYLTFNLMKEINLNSEAPTQIIKDFN